MGELLLGRPALVIAFAAPVALDVGLALTLVHRASLRLPREGFDPWVEETAANLAPDLLAELRLLLGFSGRRLYYGEELMVVAASRDAREGADFAPVLARLAELDAAEFQQMAIRAIERVYGDQHEAYTLPPLEVADAAARRSWEEFAAPAMTTADPAEAVALLLAPEELRRRTLDALRRFWEEHYAAECAAQAPVRAAAVGRGREAGYYDLARAFTEVTGMRLPDELNGRQSLNRIARVIFCPAAHLARYLSYVAYPPELLIFFDSRRIPAVAPATTRTGAADLGDEALIRALRALGDETRLRIARMLEGGELYAQEIVGRLGTISQSAVSRHLSVLEDAGVITVRPASGMKYYALDRARLRDLGDHLAALGLAGDAPVA